MTERTFGQRIKARREHLGLSARKAARLAGVSETTWRNLERGRELRSGVYRDSKPEPITVRKVATLLGWTVPDALRWAGHDPASHDDGDTAPVDEHKARLDAAWSTVPAHQRELVSRLVESMASQHRSTPDGASDTGPNPGCVNVQYAQPGSGNVLGARRRVRREADD